VLDRDTETKSLTKNVSGGGIKFATDVKFEPGTILQMQVKFPDRGLPVCFTGQVIWSASAQPANGSTAPDPKFMTGLAFADIAVKDRDFILQHAVMYVGMNEDD
jgi:hypothetical protein